MLYVNMYTVTYLLCNPSFFLTENKIRLEEKAAMT